MTIKMRSRPLKFIQLLRLSQRYISASFEKIHPLIQKLFHLQDYDFETEVHQKMILAYIAKKNVYVLNHLTVFINFCTQIFYKLH